MRVNFDFLFFINIKGEGNLTKWFVLNFEGRILLVCLLILDDEGFGNGFSGVPRLTFIHCLYLTVIYISIIA